MMQLCVLLKYPRKRTTALHQTGFKIRQMTLSLWCKKIVMQGNLPFCIWLHLSDQRYGKSDLLSSVCPVHNKQRMTFIQKATTNLEAAAYVLCKVDEFTRSAELHLKLATPWSGTVTLNWELFAVSSWVSEWKCLSSLQYCCCPDSMAVQTTLVAKLLQNQYKHSERIKNKQTLMREKARHASSTHKTDCFKTLLKPKYKMLQEIPDTKHNQITDSLSAVTCKTTITEQSPLCYVS